jgi:hypothetical protein
MTTALGNWVGESGVPWEPGTYLGNVAQQVGGKPGVVKAAGLPNNTPLSDDNYYRALYGYAYGNGSSSKTGAMRAPSPTTKRSSGGGSRGGGGGGGGGAAAPPPPTFNQAEMDWVAAMLKNGAPGAETANPLTLPQYQGMALSPFDDSRYTQLEGQFNQAVGSDRQAAGSAYDNLTNYLTGNFKNAFATPGNYAQTGNAPGSTQDAMQRMLAAQGQAGQIGAQQGLQPARTDAQGADTAFGNLLAILAGNENSAQQNRLGAVQEDRGTTNRALDIAALQGTTAIGQQKAAAKDAYQQRADERAYQDYQAQQAEAQQQAIQNWQRANQVQDTNASSSASYRNNVLSSLINLLPQIIAANGQINLPDLAALGLAPPA